MPSQSQGMPLQERDLHLFKSFKKKFSQPLQYLVMHHKFSQKTCICLATKGLANRNYSCWSCKSTYSTSTIYSESEEITYSCSQVTSSQLGSDDIDIALLQNVQSFIEKECVLGLCSIERRCIAKAAFSRSL